MITGEERQGCDLLTLSRQVYLYLTWGIYFAHEIKKYGSSKYDSHLQWRGKKFWM